MTIATASTPSIVHPEESEEFDYAKRCDEDLNRPLISCANFNVGGWPLSDVRTKLEPDTKEFTTAYILIIHTLNGSLRPDVEPPPTTRGRNCHNLASTLH